MIEDNERNDKGSEYWGNNQREILNGGRWTERFAREGRIEDDLFH